MSIKCETCPTHNCCHNIKSKWASQEDVNRFEAADNPVHEHAELATMNGDLVPGIHYFAQGERYFLKLVGWCNAFDHLTGHCTVHTPDKQPPICANTRENSDICR